MLTNVSQSLLYLQKVFTFIKQDVLTLGFVMTPEHTYNIPLKFFVVLSLIGRKIDLPLIKHSNFHFFVLHISKDYYRGS